jgi:hypothetical protein
MSRHVAQYLDQIQRAGIQGFWNDVRRAMNEVMDIEDADRQAFVTELRSSLAKYGLVALDWTFEMTEDDAKILANIKAGPKYVVPKCGHSYARMLHILQNIEADLSGLMELACCVGQRDFTHARESVGMEAFVSSDNIKNLNTTLSDDDFIAFRDILADLCRDFGFEFEHQVYIRVR